MTERNKRGLIETCKWHGYYYPDLPRAEDHIDPSWKGEERRHVLSYLKDSHTHINYRGASRCRICGCRNGTQSVHDDIYEWPIGLQHYIVVHNLKPPQDFIDHCEYRFKKALEDGMVKDHAGAQSSSSNTQKS